MNLFLPRDYCAVRKRVDESIWRCVDCQQKSSAKLIPLPTLTAAIASGMGVTVLPESAARTLAQAANGWMARITSPSLTLPLSLNVPAHLTLSPQAQAVKEILMSLISRPALESRELLLAS
ncbi:nitrogen assimilation regulatory protein Nac [Atlantibacter hermannii]|nr:nitrogen assimilation regulatory protein Nac [Atlantibacter hermannii]